MIGQAKSTPLTESSTVWPMSPKQYDVKDEIIRKLAKEQLTKFNGNVSALAREVGVSQATMRDFLNGDQGSGKKLISGLSALIGQNLFMLAGSTREPDHSAQRPARGKFEQALDAAFDGTRHSWQDPVAVLEVFRTSAQHMSEDGDLVEAARHWLDVAARLRKQGREVTAEEMLFEIERGRRPMEHQVKAFEERKDQMRKEIEAEMRTHGVEPGQAKELGKSIMERMRRLLPRE